MKTHEFIELPAKIKVRHLTTDSKKKTATKQRWVKREGKWDDS